MTAQQLETALIDAQGQPVKVTKIEIEPLPGRFRWSIYSGATKIFSDEGTATSREILAAVHAAAVLVECHSSLLPPLSFNPERN